MFNFCRDEKGKYLGNTTGVNMFSNFVKIWQDILGQRQSSEDEYKRMTLPQYYNTVEEFSAPLKSFDSPVYQAGLRLKHIETRITLPAPLLRPLRSTRRPNDLQKNTSQPSGVGMKVFFLVHLIKIEL